VEGVLQNSVATVLNNIATISLRYQHGQLKVWHRP
jgi:hypothetical protein